MKRYIAPLLALATLVGSTLTCVSSTEMPTPKIYSTSPEPNRTAAPTQPEATPTALASPIPSSVICREKPGNDLPFRTWRNADAPHGSYVTQVTDIGPAADGESVWLSTTRGLARLSLRTWQCDLLTQVAGVSLPAASQVLLADDAGGFWVGADEYLLRLSGGEWHVAYKGEASIIAMGLGQTGDLCLQMYRYFHRGFEMYWLCFAGGELPLPAPERIEGCYNEDCPLRLTNCDIWQRASGRDYSYATPDECRQVQQIRATLDPDNTSGVLVAFSVDGREAWGVKRAYPGNDRLLYQREGFSYQEEIPYRTHSVAADHVHGGAWLATESELLYVEAGAADEGATPSFAFQPLTIGFQIPSLDAGPFPGEARGLAVDKTDRVWAVNGRSVLLYDEAAEGWQEVVSPKGGADVIIADPAHGAWAAGRGELMYLDGMHQQSWPMPAALTSAPTALLVESGGRVWMGTTENGVWTVVPSAQPAGNPLDWRTFTAEDGLESAFITALAQAPDGRIYAAHHAGISVFDPAAGVESGRWVTLPGSAFSKYGGWVNALAFAPSGHLWAGTHPEGYLRRYDGAWIDYSPAWYNSLGALLVDSEGTLWAGSSRVWDCGGLWYWPAAEKGGAPDWQDLDPESLAVCNVFALAQDGRGRIWIGGPEGVVMWEGAR